MVHLRASLPLLLKRKQESKRIFQTKWKMKSTDLIDDSKKVDRGKSVMAAEAAKYLALRSMRGSLPMVTAPTPFLPFLTMTSLPLVYSTSTLIGAE